MRLVLSVLTLLIVSVGNFASTAKVTRVSDGDSFVISSGERVRMIGINAPELADPFGEQSKNHLARLINGKTVSLQSDPQNDDRDVHGRLLRFVTLNGTDVNRQMIADGYAYAFLRYPFARERRGAYREAERVAKAGRLGIWATAENKELPPVTDGKAEPVSDEGVSFSTVDLRWVLLAGVVVVVLAAAFLLGRR